MQDALTRVVNGSVFLLAETMLGHARTQPYIHHIFATMYRPQPHPTEYYVIFHKKHKSLPRNRCIRNRFQGDCLVARLDEFGLQYMPMRNENANRVDRMIEQ